jgi:hypothetical protein
MQATRSEPTAGYDTFTCLPCDLVMTYKANETGAGKSDADRKR